MKVAIVICLFAFAALASARPDEKYTSKYDDINIEEILENKKLLSSYCDCLLDKGRCTPEGKELKSHVQEAMENDCAKCTDAQKEGTKKVLHHLIKHEPECWEKLTAKYDPNGIYQNKHKEELEAAKAA